MSELAAILARRRRISDGHSLLKKQDGELAQSDVEDGTQTTKTTAAPIQSAEKHGTDRGDDIADIDDIRRLAADTDNVAIEVLENIKGDAAKRNDHGTNFASSSNTSSSPAWKPGNEKEDFQMSLESNDGILAPSNAELAQLKNALISKTRELESALDNVEARFPTSRAVQILTRSAPFCACCQNTNIIIYTILI